MVIRNNNAAWLWLSALMLVVVLGVMTVGVFRAGGAKAYPLSVLIPVGALFWLGGVALLAHVAGRACWQVVRHADGNISVTWRYPFRTTTRRFPSAALSPAQLVDSRDTEGAPYYCVRLTLPDGEVIHLAEGRRRKACLKVCRRFNHQLSSSSN